MGNLYSYVEWSTANSTSYIYSSRHGQLAVQDGHSTSEGHHEYIYLDPIGKKSESSVAFSIAHDPTPNDNDRPATPQGTLNDATPSSGPRNIAARIGSALGLGDSQVKSYTFQDSNGSTWTVNVTQDSHTLASGYVLRGVV